MSCEPGKLQAGCSSRLSPSSHPCLSPLQVSQSSQPEGSDPPGPPLKTRWHPGWPRCPLPVALLSTWLRAWLMVFSVLEAPEGPKV